MSSPAKSPKAKPTRRVAGVKQTRAAYKAPRPANRPQQKKAIKAMTSDCASHYLASLCDPENVKGACLPAGFPIPSRKSHLQCSGSIVTGNTGGNGFGGIVARFNCSRDGIAVLASTSAAYANASNLPAVVGATVTGTSFAQSDYATADIGGTYELAQYRIVSGCLKIRYTGRDDAMGGTMTWLEQPDHATLEGVSQANLRANNASVMTKVSREWQQLNYSGPATPGETEYGALASNQTNFFIGCLIANAVSSESLSFDWELHVNVEWIGQIVTGRTPTHSDANGLSVIQSAIKEATNENPFMPSEIGSVIQKVGKNLIDYAPAAAAAVGFANSSLVSAGAAAVLTGVSKYATPLIMKSIGMK